MIRRWQRRGGKRFTSEAEIKAAGCTNASLQVGRDSDGARRFYLSRGYAPRSGFEILDKMP